MDLLSKTCYDLKYKNFGNEEQVQADTKTFVFLTPSPISLFHLFETFSPIFPEDSKISLPTMGRVYYDLSAPVVR